MFNFKNPNTSLLYSTIKNSLHEMGTLTPNCFKICSQLGKESKTDRIRILSIRELFLIEKSREI